MKRAFTLAEVLVTLAIIGVAAALVLPNLVQDSQYKELAVSMQKGYADLSNATKQIASEYGGDMTVVIDGDSYGSKLMLAYKAKLNAIRYNIGACTSCGYPPSWASENVPKLQLNNGMMIQGYWEGVDPKCVRTRGRNALYQSICGVIELDVNGNKMPNTNGMDQFLFWVTRSGGFIPFGTSDDTWAYPSYCHDTVNACGACAAKVIRTGIIVRPTYTGC